MQSPGAPDLPGTSSAARLEFKLEAVTPLFLGGADPTKPEIRASSFRGALRFWFRALAAESDLARLRQREAAVFGDTSRASAVRVDASPTGQAVAVTWDALPPPRNHLMVQEQLGLNYFAFALKMPDQQRRLRCGFPPGTRLKLALGLRPGRKEEALKQAAAALWALLHLGGMGTRSRRGMGSLMATAATPIDGLPAFASGADSPEALQRHLQAGLRAVCQVVSGPAQPPRPSAYSLMSDKHARVAVVRQTWPSWQAALGDLGQRMASYRKEKGLFPRQADIGGGVPAPPADRATFGLPILYFGGDVLEPQGVGQERGRRASPLLINIARLSDNRYTIVLTFFFRAQFLPTGTRVLKLGALQLPAPASYKPVLDFLNERLVKDPGLLVVRLP